VTSWQKNTDSHDHVIRRFQSLLWLVVLVFYISSCGTNHAINPRALDGLHQQGSSDVRVMSWNVKFSSILPPNGVRNESFARIVRAIDPDVIALQEVMAPDLVAQLTQLMNGYIPLEDNGSWQVHTVSDNVIISRYPMRWRGGELAVPYPLPQLGLPNFHYGFAASLLELPESANLLVVAMHNKSGSTENDVRLRQIHADAIVRWIRDSRDSAQESSIPSRTPIVILGDMNAVPNASLAPFETLVTGDIADEETFGPDARIDWDGTHVTDARPSHNASEQEYYTWRNDDLPFAPSALDRVLYTDSVMSVRHRFVLNTVTLPADELVTLGLQRSDVLYGGNPGNYDHLPLVIDFDLVWCPRNSCKD
jgi:endonuclease/exonuclease/phosphatase family metal-dependent hydrolase